MIAEIRPLDTLFFKDGKPFSMGQETWADGVFPPYPSVIFGALRTWYISQHTGSFFQKAIEESEKIKIKQICYKITGSKDNSGIYLPMPLDFAESKSKNSWDKTNERNLKEYEVVQLKPERVGDLASSYPVKIALMPPNGDKVEEVEQGLIEQTDFMTYLNGDLNYCKIKKIGDYVKIEPKTGIGRNDYTSTALDAMLYRVGMRRASSFELLIDFEWPNQLDIGKDSSFLIKLGAEGKVAEVQYSQNTPEIFREGVKLKSNRFKLYLSTPAIFKKHGWYPDLTEYNIKPTLVAASVGKPVHIGGFDMKENRPKTMFKAVPAGSVYYYETTETPDTIMQTLFGKSISDSEEIQEQGFGIAYIGNW